MYSVCHFQMFKLISYFKIYFNLLLLKYYWCTDITLVSVYNKVIRYFIDIFHFKILKIMAILPCCITYIRQSLCLLILNPSLAHPHWYPLICSLYLWLCFFFVYSADFVKIASEYISRNYKTRSKAPSGEKFSIAFKSCWVYLYNINCTYVQKEEDP